MKSLGQAWEFKELVEEWWKEAPNDTNACHSLVKILQWVKEKMKAWSKETFGHAAKIMQDLLQNIEDFDIKNDHGVLSDEERRKWEDVKQKYGEWSTREAIKWKQRAKEQWLKEGDMNIAYV